MTVYQITGLGQCVTNVIMDTGVLHVSPAHLVSTEHVISILVIRLYRTDIHILS